MSQCGMIADATGKCIFSWRYMEEDGPSPLSVPIEPGYTVIFFPYEMDHETAFEIHTSLDQWSMDEVERILGGDRVHLRDLPAPGKDKKYWLVTGARVIVENSRPHSAIIPAGEHPHAPGPGRTEKMKQDLLDRLAGKASRQMLVEEDGTPTQIRGVTSKDRIVMVLPGGLRLAEPPPPEGTP